MIALGDTPPCIGMLLVDIKWYIFFNLFRGGSNSDEERSLPSPGALCCLERKKENNHWKGWRKFFRGPTLVTGSLENETLSKFPILNNWLSLPSWTVTINSPSSKCQAAQGKYSDREHSQEKGWKYYSVSLIFHPEAALCIVFLEQFSFIFAACPRGIEHMILSHRQKLIFRLCCSFVFTPFANFLSCSVPA